MKKVLNRSLCLPLLLLFAVLPASIAKAESIPIFYKVLAEKSLSKHFKSGEEFTGNNESFTNADSNTETLPPKENGVLYGPAPEGHEITIIARDIQVEAGTTDFSILEGVTGRLDTGEETFVWVVNDGGFSINTPGRYYVTYAAMKTKGIEFKKRRIYVSGKRVSTTLCKADDENYIKRYERFIKFIDIKATNLIQIMNDLEAMYIRRVVGAILRNDRSGLPATSQDCSTSKDVIDNSDIRVTNWPDIIATFIALKSVDASNPYNLAFLCSLHYEELSTLFWDMNGVSVQQEDDGYRVVLDTKTYSDAAKQYGFNARQKRIQQELMRPEYLRSYATLTGLTRRSSYTTQDLKQIALQAEAKLSKERAEVIRNACSLVGRVEYIWGGKYNKLGEYPGWSLADGVGATVTANESEAQVSGLDCSGFVSWVMINACRNEDMLTIIGNGSSNQWWHSSPEAWEDGLPGDLAFFAAPGETDSNHVGIIVAKDIDGNYLVAHCSSIEGSVVVTDAWSRGFRYIRRPILYEIMEATPKSVD